MLQQVGQLQHLAVYTGQGQHMLCVGLDGLSHDKIWMGGCDLGGEHGSFQRDRTQWSTLCLDMERCKTES